MKRTNIYLDDNQAELLKQVSDRRGEPVAVLVREAIDAWLEAQGVRAIGPDEWSRRFDALTARRREIAQREGFDPDVVEADVVDAVRQVRKARAARRR
jgi:ribbon-helix-helix protein